MCWWLQERRALWHNNISWLQISSLTFQLKNAKMPNPTSEKAEAEQHFMKTMIRKHWHRLTIQGINQYSTNDIIESSAKSIRNNKNFQIQTMNCNYFSYFSCKKTYFFSVEKSIQKPLWNVKILQSCIKISLTMLIWSFTTLLIHKCSHF